MDPIRLPRRPSQEPWWGTVTSVFCTGFPRCVFLGYTGLMENETYITLTLPENVDMALVVGPTDSVLRVIQEAYASRITVRGNTISIKGDPVEVQGLATLFGEVIRGVAQGKIPTPESTLRMIETMRQAEFAPSALADEVLLTYKGRVIRPKTAGQKRYVDAMRQSTVTFGIGPAGTGKTYLAMAMAVAALNAKEVSRIVLTRPVVEAGENLGFLPGTLTEKVDPYIRPLYDALFDMTDRERALQLIDTGAVEIAPLAFMRGRTFNDSFLILDEAQNTTSEQMKMFLTRLGFNSKMVVTGDATQSDVPGGRSSLMRVRRILEGIEGISFCDLGRQDVVRHSLVARIVDAYARAEEQEPAKKGKKK